MEVKGLLKIAVCDDDKDALELVCSLLEEYRTSHLPELHYTPFSSAFGLLSAMECGHHFDAVILDVLMPNTNGIQAAAEIRRRDEKMEIVFLSSSREYAVDSYEVHARNYLLKPVDRQKLFAALDQMVSSLSSGSQHSFFVRDKNGGISRIINSRLVYCEAILKDIVFYLSDGHTVTCRKALIELMKELGNDESFFQPHRSYLVNLNFVQRITKTEMLLTGGKVIPISRNKVSQAMEAFMNHSFHTLLSEDIHHDSDF